MAKQWLKQKRFKSKVYRERARGVMKRYSGERVTAPSQPNPEVMSWYKNAAGTLWDASIPVRELSYYNSNVPRQEALDLADKIKNTRPEWLYFRLIDDGFLRARMYFQFKPERCVITELDKRSKRLRRSIVYRNRDVCHQRWLSSTLDWAEVLYHPSIPETYPTPE